jgi:hypothetical protein
MLFFQKTLFEKWQVAACRFPKEFCINAKNVSTNRKKGIALDVKRIWHILKVSVLVAKNLLIRSSK